MLNIVQYLVEETRHKENKFAKLLKSTKNMQTYNKFTEKPFHLKTPYWINNYYLLY